MPRCKTNPSQFVAGMLPTVSISGTPFYVDGRLEQLRDVNDPFNAIDCVDDEIWAMLSPKDQSIIAYEFMGQTL